MTPALVARLLAALLAILPPLRYGACVARRRDAIAATVAAACAAHGVAPELLLVTGLLESQLGCDPRSGGGFGNALDRRHRHTPGTVDRAAAILATGLRRCGGDLGALRYWRTGDCHDTRRLRGYEAVDALRLVARLRAATAVGGGPNHDVGSFARPAARKAGGR